MPSPCFGTKAETGVTDINLPLADERTFVSKSWWTLENSCAFLSILLSKMATSQRRQNFVVRWEATGCQPECLPFAARPKRTSVPRSLAGRRRNMQQGRQTTENPSAADAFNIKMTVTLFPQRSPEHNWDFSGSFC